MTAPLAFLPPRFPTATPEQRPQAAEVRVAQQEPSNLPVWLTALPMAAAQIYDMETTQALRGRGGAEANPLMKPFVEGGRLPAYGMMLAEQGMQAALAKKLRDAHSKFWWVPQGISAIGHLAMGMRNQGLNR